jgi:hypothetical protein
MFDVFTEEIEVLLKDGIANLYWYKRDLYKAWLRSGVTKGIADKISNTLNPTGQKLTKREQMDCLYTELRTGEYNRRLEISRNFVRILVEHESFTPQDEKHRIEKAERCTLKLKEVIRVQNSQRENRKVYRNQKDKKDNSQNQLLKIQEEFKKYTELRPQQRGYALERLFPKLMEVNRIPVQKPFKIIGEQIDGAIKYDSHYYLIELKWTDDKIGPNHIGSFYYKVDGKLDQRGVMISMSGYTDGVIESLPKGKELKIMLLDGVHLSNVIFGNYTFHQLLDHCLKFASFRSEIYCPHQIE